MSLLTNIYYQSLAENERNLRFWEDYLHRLKSLDLNVYAEKLTVPALIPIGNRILFRGEIKHTNEVTVSLGADYFTKCSLKQAEVLRNRRIKDAQSKVDNFRKEKQYLESQITFKNQSLFEDQGQEIVEFHTEEEDKLWREKHRDNVRRSKQNKNKEETPVTFVSDEELWNRLEELELQEELEQGLEVSDHENHETNINKETEKEIVKKEVETQKEIKDFDDSAVKIQEPYKNDLLQQVLDKQYELEKKLVELRNKDRVETKTEEELMARLDELEQLEELEDEMERIEDIIEEQDDESSEEEESVSKDIKLKRSVSFADQDDSETLELTFEHTNIGADETPYSPERGIEKPSDIYSAYPNLFRENTSILKKRNHIVSDSHVNEEPKWLQSNEIDYNIVDNRTIVVKDITEKDTCVNDNSVESDKRPVSLFKKRRQQQLNK